MKTTITLRGSRIGVLSPYNPVFIERFRQIEGRKFDGDTKEWTFPACKESLLGVCDVAGILPWMLSADLQAVLKDEGVKPPVTAPVDLSLINGHKFLTTPFEHQRVNLARLIANDRWLIADEMGTGKTHALANRLAALFHHADMELHTLILCPKSVVSGWVE